MEPGWCDPCSSLWITGNFIFMLSGVACDSKITLDAIIMAATNHVLMEVRDCC